MPCIVSHLYTDLLGIDIGRSISTYSVLLQCIKHVMYQYKTLPKCQWANGVVDEIFACSKSVLRQDFHFFHA